VITGGPVHLQTIFFFFFFALVAIETEESRSLGTTSY